MNIYTKHDLDILLEEDEITDKEHGFMQGYLED